MPRSYSLYSFCRYTAFGSPINGRSVNAGTAYAYGFNGKRKDPEGLGGGGSTYDYGFRIYNPSLGKFLSVDPLTRSYSWYTPYQFAGNKPIEAIDLDGLEELAITKNYNKCGNNYSTKITVVNANGPLSITYNLLYDTDKKKIPITKQAKDFTDEREKKVFNANWIPETTTFTSADGKSSVPYVELLYVLPKEAPAKFMVEIDMSDVTDGNKGVVSMLTVFDANGEVVLSKEYTKYDLLSSKNDFVKDVVKAVGKHSSQTVIKVNVGVLGGNELLSKTIGNILKVAINPQSTVELKTRGSVDGRPKEGELRGEGGNNAQVEIEIKGGESDNSASIPQDKRG